MWAVSMGACPILQGWQRGVAGRWHCSLHLVTFVMPACPLGGVWLQFLVHCLQVMTLGREARRDS